MPAFFEWLVRASWQASVLAGLVFLIQWLFRRRLAGRWRYALWFLVLGRLLLPVFPESSLSVFNLTRWERKEPAAPPIPEPISLPELAPPESISSPATKVQEGPLPQERIESASTE